MRRRLVAVILGFLVWLGATPLSLAQSAPPIYFFYGTGCSHCVQVDQFFTASGFYDRYPIEKKEIYFDRNNAVFYNRMLADLGIPPDERGVPVVVLGQRVLAGDQPIIANFTAAADQFLMERQSVSTAPQLPAPTADHDLDLTWAAVVGASLVDAINPCAFAVLIILMTTILATGDSRRALRAGLAFAAAVFTSYFLMGLGLYQALGVGGAGGWFYTIIGWVAIGLGLFNLKDYFWYGRGFLMEVPLSWRPRMKRILTSVTSPLGALGAGFLVSLFLLPCTSGPYIVILGMLAKKTLQAQAVTYLIGYNLIFVAPMIFISLAVYRGFNPAKAEEMRQKRLRLLHLIAGLVMLAMGAVILLGWV